MPKFINSTYKPKACFGTTPQLVELRKDDKGNYFHKTQLQRKTLPPKKNFDLETLLDAKVNLEKVNTKIFQEKEFTFPNKVKQTEMQTEKETEVNNAE